MRWPKAPNRRRMLNGYLARCDSFKCEPLAEIEQVSVYAAIHDFLATIPDDSDKWRLDVPFVHRLKAVQAIASRLFDGHLPR
jgi:hypothetical protein